MLCGARTGCEVEVALLPEGQSEELFGDQLALGLPAGLGGCDLFLELPCKLLGPDL